MWMSGDVTSMPSLTRSGRRELQLRLEPALRKHVHRVQGQVAGHRRGYTSERFGAVSRRTRAPKPRRIRKLRLLALLFVLSPAGARRVHVRAADGDRGADPVARSGAAGAASAGEHVRLRERRAHDPRDPARVAGADRRQVGGHLAVAEARDRGGRGSPLLRAPRRRRAQHPARRQGGHHEPRRGPGRLDDHPAVRQERDQPERAHRSRASCARPRSPGDSSAPSRRTGF